MRLYSFGKLFVTCNLMMYQTLVSCACFAVFLYQEQLQHSPLTLDLEQVLLSWRTSTAMEMKQTSLNVDTEGLDFITVYTELGFSAVMVSQCIG